jgi:apolipoprotein D and lipocalin family protein
VKTGLTRALCLAALFLLSGCTALPENVTPVSDFELKRYLGKWYEIARLDHSFERDMVEVTAEYSMHPDGGVRVLNRGYEVTEEQWSQAEGRAHFVGDENTGHLKVSFFGPFFGSYVIFELDKQNYHYAFVSGPSKSYLWLLSRTPEVDDDVLQLFHRRAAELGFDTDALIYPYAKSTDPLL